MNKQKTQAQSLSFFMLLCVFGSMQICAQLGFFACTDVAYIFKVFAKHQHTGEQNNAGGYYVLMGYAYHNGAIVIDEKVSATG